MSSNSISGRSGEDEILTQGNTQNFSEHRMQVKRVTMESTASEANE